jgi:trehalose-6-phosphate synthase
MPLDERRARWQGMMQALRANTLSHWRDCFLDALQTARPTPEAQHALEGTGHEPGRRGDEDRGAAERETVATGDEGRR